MNAPQIVPEVDRSKFLGGSDASAVMGLSPWATPVELWMKKTGRKERVLPDERRQKIYDRGHRLEPFIRDMVIDKLRERGLEVELLACNERYVDPEFDFLSCEIDFELRLTGTLEIGGIEWVFQDEHINADAKSVTGFARKKWGEEDSEDVPIEYAVQFMHGLMITRRRFCLVAALRSFDDVDIFWTTRDDETIAGMRPKLVSFWRDHVLADVPPDTFTFSDIKALFPVDNGLAVEATQEIADKVSQLRTIRAQIKEWEAADEALTFEIADYISPHTKLTFAGADLMTWKGQNDTRVDQTRLKAEEPDTYHRFSRTKVVRVLRFVSPKKGT
jgi:predicted phage-related endonuclease